MTLTQLSDLQTLAIRLSMGCHRDAEAHAVRCLQPVNRPGLKTAEHAYALTLQGAYDHAYRVALQALADGTAELYSQAVDCPCAGITGQITQCDRCGRVHCRTHEGMVGDPLAEGPDGLVLDIEDDWGRRPEPRVVYDLVEELKGGGR